MSKTTFKDFFDGHNYSLGDNPAFDEILEAVSDGDAGRAFMKAEEAANEAEAKASKLRDEAEKALRKAVSEIEAAITAAEEQLGDAFEGAQEAVGDVVRGYGYENGLESNYSFASTFELWEASTC